MMVLLDTHVFIWWDSLPQRIGNKALAALVDPATSLFLSTASLWEMQIKIGLGKLSIGVPLKQMVNCQSVENSITILPVNPDDIYAIEALPALHKDPFDRLIIAQARSRSLKILTADPIFTSYDVPVVWD